MVGVVAEVKEEEVGAVVEDRELEEDKAVVWERSGGGNKALKNGLEAR